MYPGNFDIDEIVQKGACLGIFSAANYSACVPKMFAGQWQGTMAHKSLKK